MRTVSLCRPNTRDASLVLMPSTMQALRTRRYSSTWYIPHTFHGLLVCPYGRWRTVQFSSAVSRRLSRPRGTLYARRLQPPEALVRDTPSAAAAEPPEGSSNERTPRETGTPGDADAPLDIGAANIDLTPSNGGDSLPAKVIYVESSPGTAEGWRRYVVPTEGYAVELPADWIRDEVAGSIDDSVVIRGPNEWQVEVRRHSGQLSLLELGQSRMNDWESSGGDPSALGVKMEEFPMGNVMRFDYPDVAGEGAVTEYILVRAPLGQAGLGYSLVFRSPVETPLISGDDLSVQITESFVLLGVDTGG